jgi:hypothetical protein
MFDRKDMKQEVAEKEKKCSRNVMHCKSKGLVRPTGIEPVLRASETRILSVGRRSRVQLFADRYCSG